MNLLSGLDRTRYDPSLCCMRMGGPLEARVRELGVPIYHLGRTHKADVVSIIRMSLWLRRQKPDIVHTWLPTANLWGRIAATLAGRRVLIASERSVDFRTTRLRLLLDRALALISAAITVNSDAVREFYAARARIPQEKLELIRNGLDLSHIRHHREAGTNWRDRLLSEFGFPHDTYVVGTVGRTAEAKGLNLEKDMAKENLVNVPSEWYPERTLVVPGHPEQSYLMVKLGSYDGPLGESDTVTGRDGVPMPPAGNQFLTSDI